MRYELSDYEWTAIKPMLPNKPRGVRRVNDRRVLKGIFGSSVQVRHGATCQRPMVPAPLATIASFVGGGLACGTRSWMRWSPVMTRHCR
jgi:transposase